MADMYVNAIDFARIPKTKLGDCLFKILKALHVASVQGGAVAQC